MGGCGVRAAHETLVLPLLPAALNDRPDHPASRPSSFRVTAYCPCRLCCGPRACGITASGSRADHPLVAAPRSIPFGTVLAVPGYGRVKVEDRGGAIGDGRLDVLMPTHAEALAWGVKYLEIDT
jgi:3D (Asp-Asp-Asp) domain-containing protein